MSRLNPPNPLYKRGNYENPLYKRGNYGNFWLKLKKPILALAPMAGITDSAFRQICRELGADVVYSEMISADALYYDSKKTIEMLKIDKKEHSVVAQLFGKRPELFGKAARIAMEAGADGIDINFGCPAKKVVNHGGGVTLMRDLPLCKKIVQCVLDAVDIPVSVKIRAGINIELPLSQRGIQGDFSLDKQCELYNAGRASFVFGKIPPNPPLEKGGTVTALDFMKNIIDLPIAAIMIHGRTYEQGFSGEVDYEMIKDVVDLMKIWREDVIVLGNGGIKMPEGAKKMLEKTGADGVGIAQGVLGKPWLFREIREHLSGKTSLPPPPLRRGNNMAEIKKIALKHAKLAYKMKGDYGIIEMRKHLLWYVKGWENAKELREKLVRVENVDDIKRVFTSNPAV